MSDLIYENLCVDFREKFLLLVKHGCYLRSSVTNIVPGDYFNVFKKANDLKLNILGGYYSCSVIYEVNNSYKYDFDFLIEPDLLILSIYDLTGKELSKCYFTFDTGLLADFFKSKEQETVGAIE